MNSAQEEFNTSNDHEEELLKVTQMIAGSVLPMVMKAAIELDLFETMAKVQKINRGGEFTALDIVSYLPTQDPQKTLIMVERIFRYLASKSVLICKILTGENGESKRLYAMAPICKYFVRDRGVSLAEFFLFQNDKVIVDSWYHLKDAVLEGGTAFTKAHGENIFEYQAKDERLHDVFNKGMYGNTVIVMKMILEKYKGFKGVKKLVDVGGGLGATLGIIVSKYPNIKGVNFDLPHVIKDAPPCSGVEHVGGDMFQSVPTADVIFMKWILHDWGDDYCIKLLKNCWMALPEDGKVLVLETIVPEEHPSDVMSNLDGDMVMLAINAGGKERTAKEYEALAKKSGFAYMKVVCRASFYSVMEFYKKT